MCVASRRVTSVILAMPGCDGYTIWATLWPLMTANHVPSTISPMATLAARRAATIFDDGMSIEPGRVDDDDLGSFAVTRLTGRAGAGAGHRHHGVHVGRTLRQGTRSERPLP